MSVAVIAAGPGVVELVIVAVYVPSPFGVVGLNTSPGSLDENDTVSPDTGAPSASVTVAVAVLVDVPSAAIRLGDSDTLTAVAGPAADAGGASSQQHATDASAANATASAVLIDSFSVRTAEPSRTNVPVASGILDEVSSDPVIELCLPYRSPMDAEGVVAYLARRAVPGVEEVVDGTYARSLRLRHGAATAELSPADRHISAIYRLDDPRDLEEAVRRSRVLFDLDADPSPALAALRDDPVIGPIARVNPGRRIPGHVDPNEIAFRAVLGQQVSLAGAATLAGRLVADYGEPLARPRGGVTHLFPTAAALSDADPGRLAMPASRARALLTLAGALAGGQLVLDPAGDRDRVREELLELRGIGPWTADYVALRALRDPDVFLASDLGVRRALERLGLDGSPRNALQVAEKWRPYRATALMHLWSVLASPDARSVVSTD
jgi:AraC family transcriptional regulator of adaptative response / DNA-3-methyladenine glycosylase II